MQHRFTLNQVFRLQLPSTGGKPSNSAPPPIHDDARDDDDGEPRSHREEWQTLWRFLRPQRPLLIRIGLLGLVQIALRLLPSSGAVLIFDHVLKAQPLPLFGYLIAPDRVLWLTAGVLLGVLAVEMLLVYWQRLWAAQSGERTIHDLRQASFEKLQRLPLPYFQVRNGGKMILRFIGDMSAIGWLAEGGLVTVLIDGLTLALVFALFFWIEPLLAGAVSLVLPCFFWALWREIRPLQVERRAVRQARTDLAGALQEQFLNASATRRLADPDDLRKAFRALNRQVRDGNINLARRGGKLESIATVAAGLIGGGILLLGAWLARHGTLSAGELAAFYYLALLVLPIFGRLARFDQAYNQAMVGLERVVFLLNQDEGVAVYERALAELRPPLRVSHGLLQVRNLTFAHTAKRGLVFENLNLECLPGRITAVVGTIGAGKSSLALLLTGQLKPDAGAISIDAQNLNDCHPRSLRDQLALVEQDVEIFADSLLENICLGWDWRAAGLSKGERNQRVIELATQIDLADFIGTLHRGYKTKAGQRGVRFSAQQRAQIGLLRSLVRHPAILIIDGAEEVCTPTLLAQLRRLLQPTAHNPTPWLKTILLLTADPLVALAADTVAVLADKRIVESGAAQVLLAQPESAFSRLVQRHRHVALLMRQLPAPTSPTEMHYAS